MKQLRILIALALVLPVIAAQAQTGQPGTPANNRQILMMGLYPPDIIMKHHQRLGITDRQRKSISAAVLAFQSDVSELQWTLQNEQQEFSEQLSGYTVDSAKALAKAQRLLKLEGEFKLAHFKLLFAIKNELTKSQIDKIRQELRNRKNR